MVAKGSVDDDELSQCSVGLEEVDCELTKSLLTKKEKTPRLQLPTPSVHMAALACFITLVGFGLGFFWPRNLGRKCFDYTSMYSPILQDLDLSYHETRFNASLLYSNVYREDAGPRVDAAWHDLGTSWNNMTIARAEGLKTTIPPGSIRVQDVYGGGYTAMMEVFHQLHCLNLLRKALVYNYQYYLDEGQEEFYDGEPMLKYHVGHCLDTLRQQLMCSADVGVVPFVWVHRRQWIPKPDTEPHRLPLFDTVHRCRDFDAIREWYLAHQDPRPFNHVQWEPRADEDMMHNYY